MSDRCPSTGEEDCRMCSGEYCETHHTQPCDCDVAERHRHDAERRSEATEEKDSKKRRPEFKTSSEYEKRFRSTWELRDDLKDNPEWQMAYEYAATHKLYLDELNVIGHLLVRREEP